MRVINCRIYASDGRLHKHLRIVPDDGHEYGIHSNLPASRLGHWDGELNPNAPADGEMMEFRWADWDEATGHPNPQKAVELYEQLGGTFSSGRPGMPTTYKRGQGYAEAKEYASGKYGWGVETDDPGLYDAIISSKVIKCSP